MWFCKGWTSSSEESVGSVTTILSLLRLGVAAASESGSIRDGVRPAVEEPGASVPELE